MVFSKTRQLLNSPSLLSPNVRKSCPNDITTNHRLKWVLKTFWGGGGNFVRIKKFRPALYRSVLRGVKHVGQKISIIEFATTVGSRSLGFYYSNYTMLDYIILISSLTHFFSSINNINTTNVEILLLTSSNTINLVI